MDILITSTSSPHIVIKKELMPRRDKPLIILDLAVPRDVDPSLSECSQVNLFTVDDLQGIVDENLQFRYTIAEIINQKINLEVEKMMNWLLQSKVDPAIACICTWQEQFIKETLNLLSRDKNLDLTDKAYIEELMGTSLKRVMRKPIKRLKTLNEPEKIEEYNKIIHHLFDTTKETSSIMDEISAIK
jgi:glutamyl-tRNA reductase